MGIPPYINDRYAQFRKGNYLDWLRPEINDLITTARQAGSKIKAPILFLLATLLVLAREKQKEMSETHTADRARKTRNWTDFLGFTQKSHALSGYSPEEAIGISRMALAALHKSAGGVKTCIENFATVHDRHKPALPITQGFQKHIADLRRDVEKLCYWTSPKRLDIEHGDLKRTTASKIALTWWCYLHPEKRAGFDDIYELAQLWGLTRTEESEGFARNLRRLVSEAENAEGIDTYLWFVPSDERHTIGRIQLPAER